MADQFMDRLDEYLGPVRSLRCGECDKPFERRYLRPPKTLRCDGCEKARVAAAARAQTARRRIAKGVPRRARVHGRTINLQVLVTVDEAERLRRDAVAAGLTVSLFLRSLLGLPDGNDG